MGIGIVLFFCMSLLTTKIYDQSKEIEELELAGWKYQALRATLPANNANVIWLERNQETTKIADYSFSLYFWGVRPVRRLKYFEKKAGFAKPRS